jgi:hypothetical protein
MTISPTKSAAILAAIRRILLIIFLIGAFGIVAELLLLKHTEDTWQWVPLILAMLSLLALLGHGVIRRAATIRVFQATMTLFVISGFVGSYLHYRAKVEFKLESNPALAGWELFREAMMGGTVPPVLAPGVMIQLGLLGLAWAYRHPALSAALEGDQSITTGE